MKDTLSMRSCVIVVENLPVPFDRRVWQEACALRDAGWTVSVICPATEAYPLRRETIDNIAIYRHPLPLEARGKIGFFFEYAYALFHEFRLLFTVHRERGFSIIQGCNPPDLIFLAALPWKLRGKKYVFDHHDVCVELFEAKFGNKKLLLSAVALFEWLTFKSANLVISANETFRQLAITRGGKKPEDVVTVYSIPNKARFFKTEGNKALRAGKKTVIGYMGIIGDQDGVDNVVRMAAHLVRDHGLTDFQCLIVGDGPALESVKALAVDLKVTDVVTFTGYLSGQDFLNALSEFDIGVIPDPVNPYNDKISMNKVFEYSAMGTPIVAFNLGETRRLLGDVALYAETPDAAGLARQVAKLMQDDALRTKLGQDAKDRADRDFDWVKESAKYVAAYEGLVAR
jgi:glycosyltransferase involved in cell wall biosynthesis